MTGKPLRHGCYKHPHHSNPNPTAFPSQTMAATGGGASVFRAYEGSIIHLLSEGWTYMYEEVSSYLTEQTVCCIGFSSCSFHQLYCTYVRPKSWSQLWMKNDTWGSGFPRVSGEPEEKWRIIATCCTHSIHAFRQCEAALLLNPSPYRAT